MLERKIHRPTQRHFFFQIGKTVCSESSWFQKTQIRPSCRCRISRGSCPGKGGIPGWHSHFFLLCVLCTVWNNGNSWFVLASRPREQMFPLLSFYLQILPWLSLLSVWLGNFAFPAFSTSSSCYTFLTAWKAGRWQHRVKPQAPICVVHQPLTGHSELWQGSWLGPRYPRCSSGYWAYRLPVYNLHFSWCSDLINLQAVFTVFCFINLKQKSCLLPPGLGRPTEMSSFFALGWDLLTHDDHTGQPLLTLVEKIEKKKWWFSNHSMIDKNCSSWSCFWSPSNQSVGL